MSEKKSLEDKIREELRKTGYPTEIVSASIMQQRAWTVLHNPSFLDDTEGISREFDLQAQQSWLATTADKKFQIDVYLIAECKKSDDPWVFFTTHERRYRVQPGRLIKSRSNPQHIFWSDRTSDPPIIDEDKLVISHHYFGYPRRARTFYQPFKGQEKDNRAQMIYAAVSSVTKATLFHYTQAWDGVDASLSIFYPIIIFNGNLFEAKVHSYTDISVERADHIQLSHHYIEPYTPGKRDSQWLWEKQHEFIVDVVQESYLEQFLSTIEDEHRGLAKYLSDPLEDGRLEKRHELPPEAYSS
jgi:hypothetical protein